MPSERSSWGSYALLQLVPFAFGQLPEVYEARIDSALLKFYYLAFQLLVYLYDLLDASRRILLSDGNELRRSDWFLRLLIAGHLTIAMALSRNFPLYLCQRKNKQPVTNMSTVLKTLVSLLNPSDWTRRLSGAWLMAIPPFGVSFLQSHISKSDDFVVIGSSFVDLFPGYVPEISNGTLTVLSIFSISILSCYAFLSRTRFLVEKAFNSVALVMWLLSRSRLQVYNMTTMISQIKSNYYADRQFGVALIIDIIQSVVVHFRSKISTFYATASLSAMCQLLEGCWAELSLLNDDLSVSDGVSQEEAETDLSLEVAFGGISIMSVHVPAPPSVDVQWDCQSEVDVSQGLEADKMDNILVMEPTDALRPNGVADDRKTDREVELTRSSSVPSISYPSRDTRYADDAAYINDVECNLGDSTLIANFDFLEELETFSTAKTALPEEDLHVVHIKVNKPTVEIKYEMIYGNAAVNEITHGLDVTTCDTSGLFDDNDILVISLPRVNAGSCESFCSPEFLSSTAVVQSEAILGKDFKPSSALVSNNSSPSVKDAITHAGINVFAEATLPDPNTASKVKRGKRRGVDQEALKMQSKEISGMHSAYRNAAWSNSGADSFNFENHAATTAKEPATVSGLAKASGPSSGIGKRPRDSMKSSDRHADRASLNLLSKRYESLHSSHHALQDRRATQGYANLSYDNRQKRRKGQEHERSGGMSSGDSHNDYRERRDVFHEQVW